jgi:hypothetical protein
MVTVSVCGYGGLAVPSCVRGMVHPGTTQCLHEHSSSGVLEAVNVRTFELVSSVRGCECECTNQWQVCMQLGR